MFQRWLRKPDLVGPATISSRDFASESVPDGGDVRVFDNEPALRINRARLAAIEAVGLDLTSRRVLDVGSGPGHFVDFYRSRGCDVTAIEGRPEIVSEFRRRHPDVPIYAGNVERFDFSALGRFDIVHCFGLLYHLENPIAALRNLFDACAGVLLLETIVLDAEEPLLALADEPKTVNQALGGIAIRPSRAFVAMALNRVGFRHVYGLSRPPSHEDFQVDWLNDRRSERDGHPIRSIFVASHHALMQPALRPLLS